jgi:hypothetical protein
MTKHQAAPSLVLVPLYKASCDSLVRGHAVHSCEATWFTRARPCGSLVRGHVVHSCEAMWFTCAMPCGSLVRGHVGHSCAAMWFTRARPCGSLVRGHVVHSCEAMWFTRARPCGSLVRGHALFNFLAEYGGWIQALDAVTYQASFPGYCKCAICFVPPRFPLDMESRHHSKCGVYVEGILFDRRFMIWLKCRMLICFILKTELYVGLLLSLWT